MGPRGQDLSKSTVARLAIGGLFVGSLLNRVGNLLRQHHQSPRDCNSPLVGYAGHHSVGTQRHGLAASGP